MNEKEREQVALFRFGLIAPLYNGQVDSKTYLNEVEGKVHQMPYYGERRIAAKTVQDWLLKYRKGGFEALKPKKRSDRGYSRRLSPEGPGSYSRIKKKISLYAGHCVL